MSAISSYPPRYPNYTNTTLPHPKHRESLMTGDTTGASASKTQSTNPFTAISTIEQTPLASKIVPFKRQILTLNKKGFIGNNLLRLLDKVYTLSLKNEILKKARQRSQQAQESQKNAYSILTPLDNSLLQSSPPSNFIVPNTPKIAANPFDRVTYDTPFFYNDQNYDGFTLTQITLMKNFNKHHGYGKLQLYLKEKGMTSHLTDLEAIEAVRKAAYRYNAYPYTPYSSIYPRQITESLGLQFLYGAIVYQL